MWKMLHFWIQADRGELQVLVAKVNSSITEMSAHLQQLEEALQVQKGMIHSQVKGDIYM